MNTDSDEEVDSRDKASGGGSNKVIRTLIRVNPSSGFKVGHVYIDNEYNEVVVAREASILHTKATNKSFVVDTALDIIPKGNDFAGKKIKSVFVSQQVVWDNIRVMLDRRFQEGGSDIMILANGSSGSGKTYTLFGESNYEDRGVVPRFVDYIFDHQGKNKYKEAEDSDPSTIHAQQVFLSMTLICGEELVDLLHVNNPLRRWNQHEHLAYSDSMGPLNLAAQYVVATNAAELNEYLGMGLKAGAACVNMISELYANTSISVTMLIVNGESRAANKTDMSTKLFATKNKGPTEEELAFQNLKVTKVTFMELPSIDNPTLCPVEVDRLTGVSPQYRGARSLHLPVGVGNSGGNQSSENPYLPGHFNAYHRKSVVNYLLQDSLYKYPHAIIITCLRGASHSYDDDILAMDVMNELSDNYNRDGKPRESLCLRDCISELEAEARIAERGAARDEFQEFIDAKYKTGRDSASRGGEQKDNRPGTAGEKGGKDKDQAAPKMAIKQSRRTRDIKPLYEYSLITRDEAVLLRKKCNFLRHLAEYLSLCVKKDKESREGLQRICNYVLPFVPAFHKSMSTPYRGIVMDFDIMEDPTNKVPFTDVMRGFLQERGFYLKPQKKKIVTMYDGIDFGDEEEEEEEVKMDPKKNGGGETVRPNTTGIAHGVPWSYDMVGVFDAMEPYGILLSPNSGLAQFYGKIPLPKGTTVIRGKSGNASMSDQISRNVYSTTPSENDTDKDVNIYRESLKDLCGENIIPRIALDMLEAEIRQEIEEATVVDDESKVSKEELFEYESPDADKKKKEEKEAPKDYVNFVYMHGPGVFPLHCIFRTENLQSVYVRPNNLLVVNGKPAKCEVFVNGLPLVDEIPLQDNDVVRIGASRFLLIRIPIKPMKMNEINSIAREENFAALTAWELGMVRGFGPQLKEAIGASETNRRHVSHIAVNRELTAVMKTADRTPLHRMETYQAPDDLVDAVYKAIAPNDKAYLCNIIGASNLVNYWAVGMRRYVKTTFQLVATSKHDQDSRGRIIIMDMSALAASAAAQATSNQGKKTKKDIMLDEFGVPIDDEDEESIPEVVAANPTGRRKGIRQVGGNNAAEATTEERLFSGSICLENIGDRAGKFFWNCPILCERLYLMKCMAEYYNSAWCSRDTAWLDSLYEPDQDPFNDTQEDELIGVGYLYLDTLQYLVDTNDIVPIVNLQGHKCGAIKIKGRVWVDKIETAPPYLTIDKETNLKEFESQNCVLRLYFESLMDLPPNHCSSTFVRFNFFYHNKAYTTTRHGGSSVHPFLHNAIRVDQRITGDFLEYIARGSLELEVYGKRKVKETRKPSISKTIVNNYITGEVIPDIVVAEPDQQETSVIESSAQKDDDGGASAEEAFEEKIRDLTVNLQKSQNTLNANKKIIENLASDKSRLEDKIKRQEAKFAEFEETLPAKYRPSSQKGKVDTPADGSAACTIM